MIAGDLTEHVTIGVKIENQTDDAWLLVPADTEVYVHYRNPVWVPMDAVTSKEPIPNTFNNYLMTMPRKFAARGDLREAGQ